MSIGPEEIAHLANRAAEILHDETGAPFVLVILAGEHGKSIVIGAWAPSVDEIRRICSDLIEKIDRGETKVTDLRSEEAKRQG